MIDSKQYLMKYDKLNATSRRTVVVKILRSELMRQFPVIFGSGHRNRFQLAMDTANALGRCSAEAKVGQ